MTDLEKYTTYQTIPGSLQIEDISILNGANYFSAEKVIRFRVNLNNYDEVYTNDIPGFFESLKTLIPTLYQHHCSLKKPGGFFERIKEGTLLGHVIEHVAIELQTLAGMDVGFGKTRISKVKGVYNIVFRFFDEIAGKYAGIAAINLINSILQKVEFSIQEIIENLVTIREIRMLGFSTQAIVDEADKRNIPWLRLDKYNLVQLGTGKYRKVIQATITGETSLIAVEITDNKYKTTGILSEYGVPVPNRLITKNVEEAIEFFNQQKAAIVIKPALGGYQGKRVSVNLQTEATISHAFAWAKEFDDEVIVQQFIHGNTYRILTIDYKFAAAVHLQAAVIKGDGTHTINQLIEKINAEPVREVGDKGKLSKVIIDEDTLKILELKGFTTETILPPTKTITLKNTGNMKLGASSTDVTDFIHPYNIFICERISKILNIDVAGIDIISPDISKPITENNACVIEVNAAPDFRMHINPTNGEPRKVQELFMDMLFPKESKTHIPIISITGSHGKTLAAYIIRNTLSKVNFTVGTVCSDGIFINENCLKKDINFDTVNAGIILKDPTIDCAVIETNVETILQYGLGYKFADIGIILNLDENKSEYFAYDHIKDIVDVAYAKSVVAEETFVDGFAILNADNDLILEMTERIYSKPILFSCNSANEKVLAHIQNNGIAVVLNNGKIVIYDKQIATELMPINQVPLMFSSQNNYEHESMLAAVAALYVYGISVEEMSTVFCTLTS